MVRRYDLAQADPDARRITHRVSTYLLGSLPGQLGQDFRRWAGDGQMSDRLRSEITAYQLCVLDDSFVEGPHANIGRVGRSASTPSPSWWSATVRMAQNFQEYDRSVLESPGRFEQLFDSWKLVAQFRKDSYLSGQIRRIRKGPLLRFVYRTGATATQRDWTVLRPLADKTFQDLPHTKPGDFVDLMKEYLLAICVPGSVVEFHDSRGVSAAELVSGSAQVEGQGPLVPVRHFFEVVSRSLVSKKFISTANLVKMKRMQVPLVLQRLTLCDCATGQDLPQSVIAFPEGNPEVQDVRTLGSWADLRRRSHSWSVEAITDEGSLRLTARQSLGQLVWTAERVAKCG